MSTTRVQKGLAYVEVVLAAVMVAVLLVPALNALSSGLMSQQVADQQGAQALSLQSKLDEVLAMPYSRLLAETYQPGGNSQTSISTALSDSAGTSRRVVTLYRTNGSDVSALDTGLLRIRVVWEGAPSHSGLEALRSRWL